MDFSSDEYFMKEALKEAQKALEEAEVPVGAVVACEKQIVARAYNQVERLEDATAHAEMLALTAAMEHLNAKYLPGCSIYVTAEPCLMCAGALHLAQVAQVAYGTGDSKKGFTRYAKKIFPQKTKVKEGILQERCAELMIDFFAEKRTKK